MTSLRRSRAGPPDLRRAFDAARERFPGVKLTFADFEAHVEQAVEASGLPAARLALEDLYLAKACLEGDTAAQAALERDFVRPASKAAVRRSAPSDLADETCQALLQALLVARGGGPGRLADYEGRGGLERWIRAVALRTAINLRRGEKPTDNSERALLGALPDAPSPELRFIQARYRVDFGAAFQQALAELPARDRTLLKLTALDGLTAAQAGVLMGAHRVSVAKWLSEARKVVLARTRAHLAERLKLDTRQLDSLLRLDEGELDLSLRRFLKD